MVTEFVLANSLSIKFVTSRQLTVAPKLLTFSYPEFPAIVIKPPFDNASVNGGSCDGFDTPDHFDSSASWCGAGLAVQQELGLWTKRWHRVDPGDRFDPAAIASHLKQWHRL